MSDRHARVSELFLQVSELPADKRAAFLDRECGDDAALRAEVESLLEHDRTETGVLGPEGMGKRIRKLATEPPTDAHPDRVGPYRILEVLGEGAMGTVYLAEQREPLQRRVALKLVKWGMDTEQFIARFESE